MGMIADIDYDGNGEIDLGEFLRLMASKLQEDPASSIDEMREAFLAFDSDKNGSITATELKQVMKSLGEQLTDEQVELMMQEMDADGDGELSFEDFLQFMEREQE